MTSPIGRGNASQQDDDLRTLQRISEGDTAALGRLYDRHSRLLFALAFRMTADRREAEEVVQDVFLHAWRTASRYDAERATVAGWLVMMTRSRAIDRLRAARTRPAAPSSPDDLLGTLADPQPGPESQSIRGQTAERLRAALRELPAAMRRTIELAYFEGLSQTAIAERIDEPLGTVKTRMRTALFKLRRALTSDGRHE